MLIAILAASLSVPTAQEQASIKNAFEDVLLDAASARFRWPKLASEASYCGWVNAKNAVGAFTGWQQYYLIYSMSKDNKLVVIGTPILSNDPKMGSVASKMCIRAGYSSDQKMSELPES